MYRRKEQNKRTKCNNCWQLKIWFALFIHCLNLNLKMIRQFVLQKRWNLIYSCEKCDNSQVMCCFQIVFLSTAFRKRLENATTIPDSFPKERMILTENWKMIDEVCPWIWKSTDSSKSFEKSFNEFIFKLLFEDSLTKLYFLKNQLKEEWKVSRKSFLFRINFESRVLNLPLNI